MNPPNATSIQLLQDSISQTFAGLYKEERAYDTYLAFNFCIAAMLICIFAKYDFVNTYRTLAFLIEVLSVVGLIHSSSVMTGTLMIIGLYLRVIFAEAGRRVAVQA